MQKISIQRGLELPLYGAPEQKVYPCGPARRVAVLGPDYHGMRPSMAVQVGDRVKKGQLLFSCKKREGVRYTAPGGGVVSAIQRGERRAFEALIIELDSQDAEEPAVSFQAIADLGRASREQVERVLVESGMWTALRTRPYSRCPLPGPQHAPASIFVTAMDSNPLAADQELVIARQLPAFHHGLRALAMLTPGTVYVCTRENSELAAPDAERVQLASFAGPHPAGNAGTHIHFLGPASEHRTHWWLDAQDAIAMGNTLLKGVLDVERVISFAGPQVKHPRLLQTRQGADLDELAEGQLKSGESRIISGSVWCGRKRCERFHFLSRFARQVSALAEGHKREFLGWHSPGIDKFSVKPIYLSALDKSKKFHFTTTSNGSPRAMVPIGMYEKVMPLDILPTQLLRALCTRDTEMAQQLGALELDEEDLALCTFVDPGKTDYGPLLRETLELIEREG